jgi:hypothetical protein
MVRFEDLAVFTRASALGSFSRAAREIGQPASRVSAAIKRLEKDLNARLFARSTRSLRLTIEGERYLPYAEKTLSTLREAKEALHLPNDRLCGLIRLSMPSDVICYRPAFLRSGVAIRTSSCRSRSPTGSHRYSAIPLTLRSAMAGWSTVVLWPCRSRRTIGGCLSQHPTILTGEVGPTPLKP